jgi:hypothetical protein
MLRTGGPGARPIRILRCVKASHDPSPDDGTLFGPPGSRFAHVSRRAFLARSAAFGAAAAAGLASCGHNDADVFARDPSAAPTTGPAPTPTSTARAPGTSSTTVATTSSAPATTSPSPSTAASGDVAVRFTYKPASSGGRVNNPYVAVWIEDSAGELVETLGLWYLQGAKGQRWLNELRRWYSVDGSTTDTTTSATRTPGDYALVWERSGATSGEYFVCIEAAREHGPYSLIRQQFTLGDAPFTTALPSQGELTNASIAHPAG